jgi:hypothetical protein
MDRALKADPKGSGHFPEPIDLIKKLDAELGGDRSFDDLKNHQTSLIATRDKINTWLGSGESSYWHGLYVVGVGVGGGSAELRIRPAPPSSVDQKPLGECPGWCGDTDDYRRTSGLREVLPVCTPLARVRSCRASPCSSLPPSDHGIRWPGGSGCPATELAARVCQ